ncbi:hypothetical protein SAMN04487891_1198 [Flagellimonas taeanensis]|uniref:Uncharacterized protein n=1 Tax=Flagellimonas taeanensis TaxID=1005926 RepID=A0A1M7CWG0_9FLAO|nr:hypothetical protein SAMN04487891_1198 [Allomuricauda taeanensis]SHL71535.1 hypothetical protein SAMN05216293_4131 [Allomuricauda taeanensis]
MKPKRNQRFQLTTLKGLKKSKTSIWIASKILVFNYLNSRICKITILLHYLTILPSTTFYYFFIVETLVNNIFLAEKTLSLGNV